MAERHYSIVIHQRLKTFLTTSDKDGFTDYMASLSNSDFRTAGYVIGEKMMAELTGDDFWETFVFVVEIRPKAFLVTLLKAFVEAYFDERVRVEGCILKSFLQKINEEERTIDKMKFLSSVLPVIKTPSEVEWLLTNLCNDNTKDKVYYLLLSSSVPAYYVLFCNLKKLDSEKDYIAHCCFTLMKKGDDKSFNMARILKSYFGLPEMNSTFSLRIQPYEFSYIDTSYTSFKKVLLSI